MKVLVMMTCFEYPIKTLLPAVALLGESPVWSVEEQALYWVDIIKPAVYCYDPATGTNRAWPASHMVGSICLNNTGKIVAALRNGFHWLDKETGDWTLIARPDPDLDYTRLNDGKAGPDGAFWAGTMDLRPIKEPCASLFRLAPDGTVSCSSSGLLVSNGLAWSPDGHTMYHSDSRGLVIYQYAFDPATGKAGERQLFCKPEAEWGRPDGAAVDVNGCYWSCGNGAGRINQFSPQGQLLGYIPVPVSAPTMCAFGGADMKTLYVASMVPDSPEGIKLKCALDGSLFAIDMPVAGAPVGRYAG
jgi:sugar lactone lactonase YvrE